MRHKKNHGEHWIILTLIAAGVIVSFARTGIAGPLKEKEPAKKTVPASEAGENISWGADTNGLCVGLSCRQAKYQAGKTIELTGYVKNIGNEERSLSYAFVPCYWDLEIKSKTGKVVHNFTQKRNQPVEKAVTIASDELKPVSLKFDLPNSLPEGRYCLTAICQTTAGQGNMEPYGAISTGPVYVEIAGAVPPATTSPTSAPAANQEEIKNLIVQLGDKDVKVRDAATQKLKTIGKSALPALREVAKNTSADSETVERTGALIKEITMFDPGEIVNGLRGVIRAKDSKIKPGDDIQIEFTLHAPDKPVFVWDGKYSNGYRNHSFEVQMPNGDTKVLKIQGKREWSKNAPHPVEITKDKPYILPEWVEGQTFKSLKALGLDTAAKGKYVITGIYEEVAGNDGNVKLWGGKLVTNSITVEVAGE